MSDYDEQVIGDELAPVSEEPYGDRDDRGDFGAWAPGVLDGFLTEVLKDRKATAAGAIIGQEEDGKPLINGIVATVEHGAVGAVAFERTSWGWVHEARTTYYPDSTVIGWYCSRPNVGARPTEVDVETHSHYFPNGNYVMICVDPVAALIAAYVADASGAIVSLGSGDLHQMLGIAPLEESRFKFSPQVAAAAVLGVATGLLAWAIAGGGAWPFA
jgi:proteasome lid subunit RPN8/RPN11